MSDCLLFQEIQVFDGTRSLGRTNVLVDGGSVVGVGVGDGPAGVTVVPGAGRTLLPGLIDAHIHLAPGALARGPRFGVTTQLDMFADPKVLAAAKAEAAARTDVSDVRSAGIGATAPGGHPTQLIHNGLFGEFPTVASVRDVEAFVAARVEEGADYLKIFASSVPGEPHLPTLGEDMVTALVAAAHRNGLLAVVHATDAEAALAAVRAGADGLAHLPFDRPLDEVFVSTVAEHGVFVVPTLTMLESFCQLMSPPPAANYVVGNAASAVPALLAAGVDVLVGTDAGAPGTAHGASVHRELELLVRAGMSPWQALAAATSAPARRFGLADRGRIAPGMRADLLVVRGNPGTAITSSRDIVAVYRAGHQVRDRNSECYH
jgi:imidazolonepropionase-like amidohydrolase